MWFECSECGSHVQGPSAPVSCPECGVAGAIFVAADSYDLIDGDFDGDGLRTMWLRAGLEQPELLAAP